MLAGIAVVETIFAWPGIGLYMDRAIASNDIPAIAGVTLLIALRLLPIVPFSLISAAAGAARVPFPRYCWTTAIGFLPITALAVYLGTRLEGIRFTDPAVIGAIVGVVLLLLVAHLIIKRSGATDDGPGATETPASTSDESA